ncbi:MAG: hypothetical protein Q8R35_02245, partial [bacterium]|nr:hypothetical protein [bacterium]
GQHPEDFYGLARKTKIHFNVIAEGASLVSRNLSPGFLLLLLFGFAAAVYRVWNEQRFRPYGFMLGFSILLALAALTAVGGGDRFGAILIPFVSLIIGIGIVQLLAVVAGRKRALVLLALAVVGMGELFFMAQTQWTSAPLMQSRFGVALNRPTFAGYNALDQYVRDFYRTFPGAPHVILFTRGTQLAAYQEQRTRAQFKQQPNLGPQTHLLLFDDRMNWFAGVWIFERRRLYDASPIYPISQFIKEDPAFYARFGFRDVTIITADERILPADEDFSSDPRTLFVEELEGSRSPMGEIRNPAGEVVFRVFRFPLAS